MSTKFECSFGAIEVYTLPGSPHINGKVRLQILAGWDASSDEDLSVEEAKQLRGALNEAIRELEGHL